MKTSNYFFGILAAMILFSGKLMSQTGSNAETKFVNVKLNISLNGLERKHATYLVNVMNLNLKREKTIQVSGTTQLLLEYNTQYEITVNCDGYNTKIVELDTDGPVDNWLIMADVDLSSKNHQVIHGGKIAYDKESHSFKATVQNKTELSLNNH